MYIVTLFKMIIVRHQQRGMEETTDAGRSARIFSLPSGMSWQMLLPVAVLAGFLYTLFGIWGCSVLNKPEEEPLTAEKKAVRVLAAENKKMSVPREKREPVATEATATATTNEFILHLKRQGLWDLSGKKKITPFVVQRFPASLRSLDVTSKKRAFLHGLLPAAKIALREVELERQRLLGIVGDSFRTADLLISPEMGGWQEGLSDGDNAFLLEIAEKYRSRRVETLLKRVDGLPVSLVLAQAAIESSWGTSRFTLEGNNIFGVWTWGEKGMIPTRREEGKTHKVAAYATVLDSIRAYLLTLNRHEAHQALRNIRQMTRDPLVLAEGLMNYSERRDEYVDEVRMVIDYNRLQRYDSFQLAAVAGKEGEAAG